MVFLHIKILEENKKDKDEKTAFVFDMFMVFLEERL